MTIDDCPSLDSPRARAAAEHEGELPREPIAASARVVLGSLHSSLPRAAPAAGCSASCAQQAPAQHLAAPSSSLA